jgi:uncharacterized delta-60 repeat protein
MKTRIRPRVEALEGRTLLSAGNLDLSFGGTGVVWTRVGSGPDYPWSVDVQPDLKVVDVGWGSVQQKHYKSPVNVIGLVRYNQDGTLDGSFGSGGTATLPVHEFALSLPSEVSALQADGKIIVAIGATINGSNNPSVVSQK